MKKIIEFIKSLLKPSSDKSSKGFTLVELLIVIAILGILAAGLLAALNPAERLRESRDTTAIQSLTQGASRLDQWIITNGAGGSPGTIPTNEANALRQAGLANRSDFTFNYYPNEDDNEYVLEVSGLKSKKVTDRAAVGNPAAATTEATKFIYVSSQGQTCYKTTGMAIDENTVCP